MKSGPFGDILTNVGNPRMTERYARGVGESVTAPLRVSSGNYMHPFSTMQNLYFWVKDVSTTTDAKVEVQKGMLIKPAIVLADLNNAMTSMVHGQQYVVAVSSAETVTNAQTISLKLTWSEDGDASVASKNYRVPLTDTSDTLITTIADSGGDNLTLATGTTSEVGGEIKTRVYSVSSATYVVHNTASPQTDTYQYTYIPIADFDVVTNAGGDKFLNIRQRHVGALMVYPFSVTTAYGQGD